MCGAIMDTSLVKMKYLAKSQSDTMRQVFPSVAPATVCLPVSVVFAVLASFSAGEVTQHLVEAPHSGLINSAAAVFNAATGKSYVVDSDGSSIEVSNDRTDAKRSVKVGSHPVSIAVDSQNGRAYVVNAGDGTVSV